MCSRKSMPDSVRRAREPEWRWLQATNAVEVARRLSPRRDDARMQEVVRFVRELLRCKDEAARGRLARRRPTLTAAHSLYTAVPSWPRWELEARLLTDEPFEEIALCMGMSEELVVWYHDVYFDVRRRLHASDWVASHVLNLRASLSLATNDTGLLLKLYAYRGGTLALESLLEYFRNPPVVPDRPELLDPQAFHSLCDKLAVKASVVSRSLMPESPRASKKLAQLREATELIRHARKQFDAADVLTAPPAMATDLPYLTAVLAGPGVEVATTYDDRKSAARAPEPARAVLAAA